MADHAEFSAKTWIPARRRLAVSVIVGLAVVAVAAAFSAWQVSLLLGWCAGAATFTSLAAITMRRVDGPGTRAIANRADESRADMDFAVLMACVASLVGTGLILFKASHADGLAAALMTALGVAAVVLAWATVHVVFTLRYADLYYSQEGGIDFHGMKDPSYADFAYLAFTIGMTYQVSDTDLLSATIRHAALRHALLSYLFGAVIIAMTINVVASIAH